MLLEANEAPPHLVVPGAHEVLDDVAAGGIPARVTEPLARLHAAHDARRVVNATETACPFGSLRVCGIPRGRGG